MKEKIENSIIKIWGEPYKIDACIDEKLEDIILAIKYSDHGDDFIVVKTETNIYIYGWFLNRYGYYDLENYIGKNAYRDPKKDGFVRFPKKFYKTEKTYTEDYFEIPLYIRMNLPEKLSDYIIPEKFVIKGGALKRVHPYQYIYFDEIEWCFYKQHYIKTNRIMMYPDEEDEWGCITWRVNLDNFRTTHTRRK